MRYYKLTISPPNGNPIVLAQSHPNGQFDPGALDVQFDLTISAMYVSGQMQYVRVYGVPMALMSNAFKLADTNNKGQESLAWGVSLEGGMMGPPLLGTPRHGLLAIGSVYSAYGNWVGTNMTLDLFIAAPYMTPKSKGAFVFSWVAGQPLSNALDASLGAAYEGTGTDIQVNISAYTTAHHVYHVCDNLASLARLVRTLTMPNAGQNASGPVIIGQTPGTVIAFDGTMQIGAATKLSYEDLIGQPTWIDVNQMQVTCVMRNDLHQGSLILMPPQITNRPGLTIQTPRSFPNFTNNYGPAFTGSFRVNEVRHIGNFRGTDSTQWVTVVNCNPETTNA